MKSLVDEILRDVVTDLGIPFRVDAVELVDITRAYSVSDHSIGQMHSIKITLRKE